VNASTELVPSNTDPKPGLLELDLMEVEKSEKILCICYTIHALDDFLESLVDSDVILTSIVHHDYI